MVDWTGINGLVLGFIFIGIDFWDLLINEGKWK